MRVETTFSSALRLSRPDDLLFVARLTAEAFAAYGDYRDPVRAWFDNPGVFTLIAEDGGAPAGFAMLGFVRERPTQAWVADVLAIAVAPEARRRGIGRRLVDELVAVARRLGAPLGVAEVRLSAAETNGAARRLFESAGFAVCSEQGSYDGGQRAIRMARRL